MLPLIIISSILTAYLAICLFFSETILHPRRQPLVKNPRDYGMGYENVEFESSDGLKLKGWLIPGASDRIIVIAHPGSFNRCGTSVRHQGFFKFAVKDVEFLKTARQLQRAGYWVLMFDFRNHGASQTSRNGGITGVGLDEWRDVIGAVNFIENNSALKDKKIGLVSFCMGANASIIALSKAKKDLIGVKCLLAIQPVSTNVFIRSFVRDKYTSLGVRLFVPLTDKICQWRGGYPLAKMSPREFARDIFIPALYVQTETDPWTELSDIGGFYDQTPEPKEFLLLKGKMNRFDTYNYFGDHPEKMLEFLDKWMN